jgi:hypothetical protein
MSEFERSQAEVLGRQARKNQEYWSTNPPPTRTEVPMPPRFQKYYRAVPKAAATEGDNRCSRNFGTGSCVFVIAV